MRKFGIFSPILGQREDFPVILLRNAFTPDNSNVQIWDGEMRSALMRTKELFRTSYQISSLSGNDITISGLHAAEFATNDTVGVYTFVDGSKSAIGTAIIVNITQSTDTILTVDNASDLVTGYYIYNKVGNVIEDLKVPTPDGNPVIKYHFHTAGAEQIEYLLAFTKAHVYRWLSTTQTWFTLWTCSSACTGWSVESYGDKVVATNDIDPPLIWTISGVFDEMGVDGHGPEISTGVYISKAKCVTIYNNIIILGHITLSDNTYLPHHVYWGDLGLDNVWKPASDNIAGNMFVNGSGYVVSFGQKQGQLFTFKSDSINRAWFTGTVDVFNQEVYHDRVGCIAPDSIVSDEVSKLYFYGSDYSFREMDDGRISQPIDKTARNLMPDLIGDIRGTYIAEYDEIWWAVPYGNSATANNKVLVYKDGKWLPRDIAVTAFGHWYRNATWTWDTLPFNTWNEWGWDSWDSVSGHKGFAVDICSDADGYTYACHIAHADIGEAVTSYFVLTTDLADKQALDIYKRLLFIEPYVMNEGSGTLSIQIKRDSEVSWQSAGSISMDGTPEILTQKIPVSYLAKHFLIKMTGTDPFRFIGVILHFETVGDR